LIFDVPDGRTDAMRTDAGAALLAGLDSGLRTADFGLSLACPRCANAETILAGGEELDIAYLEVEE
jgi:hypothetical protein